MLATLSERKLSEQIRQLEGINDTLEEISDRMQHYFGRLARHLSQNHGVTFVGMVEVQPGGALATAQFSLKPIYDESDRADRISGLNLLNPNSITVEFGDLPALVPNSITRTMLEDEWGEFEHQLRKILPSQISEILERAAGQVISKPSSTIIGDPECDEYMLQDFLRRSGKKDPLAKHMARERAEQEEQARIQAQRDLEYERFRNAADEW